MEPSLSTATPAGVEGVQDVERPARTDRQAADPADGSRGAHPPEASGAGSEASDPPDEGSVGRELLNEDGVLIGDVEVRTSRRPGAWIVDARGVERNGLGKAEHAAARLAEDSGRGVGRFPRRRLEREHHREQRDQEGLLASAGDAGETSEEALSGSSQWGRRLWHDG